MYVSGTVYNADYVPLSFAYVKIYNANYSSEQYANWGGEFAFIVPGGKTYSLYAWKEGYQAHTQSVPVGSSPVKTYFALQPVSPPNNPSPKSESGSSGDTQAKPTATPKPKNTPTPTPQPKKISGYVYMQKADGSIGTYQGATIRIENIAQGGGKTSRTTNSSGYFEFISRASGTVTYRLTLLPIEGYSIVSSQVMEVTISSGDHAKVNFSVKRQQPLGKITGRLFFDRNGNGILDENPETGERDGGKAFNGQTVAISGKNYAKEVTTAPGASGSLQANGTFTFGNLQPGTYTVSLRTVPEGYRLTTPANLEVTVTPGSTQIANFLLRLPSKLKLIVKVQDEQKAFVNGATVIVCTHVTEVCQQGTTSSEGQTAFAVPPLERYSITATKGSLKGSVSVHMDTTGRSIVITIFEPKPEAVQKKIVGTVEILGGRGYEGATVIIKNLKTGSTKELITDKHGRFEFVSQASGTPSYRVELLPIPNFSISPKYYEVTLSKAQTFTDFILERLSR